MTRNGTASSLALAALVGALALPASADAARPRHLLRYRATNPAIYYLRTEHASRTSFLGGASTHDLRSEERKLFRSYRETEEGDLEVVRTYGPRFLPNDAGELELEEGSELPPQKFRMTGTGMASTKDAKAPELAAAPLVLPIRPVRKGDSWTTDLKTLRPDIPVEADLVHTLVRIDEAAGSRLATIRSVARAHALVDGQKTEYSLEISSVFDVDVGILIHQVQKFDTRVVRRDGDAGIALRNRTTTELLWDRALPTDAEIAAARGAAAPAS